MHKVKVKLDKVYTLAFGTKALRRFERESGRTFGDIGDSFGIDVFAALLHAGMVYDHPDITEDDIDAILDKFLDGGGDIGPVIGTVTEAAGESGWFADPTKKAASTKDSGETPAE